MMQNGQRVIVQVKGGAPCYATVTRQGGEESGRIWVRVDGCPHSVCVVAWDLREVPE